MTMAQYRVEVTTGDYPNAGTADHIYITLFGTDGKSERTELDNAGVDDFQTGTSMVKTRLRFCQQGVLLPSNEKNRSENIVGVFRLQTGIYTLKTGSSLGKILLVKVEKDPFFLYPEDEWYCSKIVVKTPEGDEILFPCYRWVSRRELVELRGGKAVKPFEEEHPLLAEHRKNELKFKKSLYQWAISDEELPHHSSFKHAGELPAEICSTSKATEMLYKKGTIAADVVFRELAVIPDSWEKFEDMKQIFWFKKTSITEYLTEHWKEDDFWGYQFLNAVNSNVIKRCSELPSNFAVTEEMVKSFLEKRSSLQNEMKKGNIFICDFKQVDGLPLKKVNGEPLQVTTGFCLFYLNPEDKLMPIAIQLKQQPSEQNPIFLPSDSEPDWLLAKICIKNTDVMLHQAIYHFQATHCVSEVLAVSTLRNFPVIHPIYKLLVPHIRDTLQINTMGRNYVSGSNGLLSKSSLGHDGMMQLLRETISKMTYSSICLPDSIKERGLESIPNFYYRDDGLRLWNIINSFVKGIVEYYYPSDSDVREDNELQEWVNDMFKHLVLGNKASGFPEAFNTVEEVIKFITSMIFTVSAQHSAVNSGMFDYQVWTPSGSLTLRKSPPTAKGATMKTVLDTLPSVGQTAGFAANVWVLSDKYTDRIFLGDYPKERFDEPVPKQMIKKFQAELAKVSESISARNSKLAVPYTYMNPAEVENSITI